MALRGKSPGSRDYCSIHLKLLSPKRVTYLIRDGDSYEGLIHTTEQVTNFLRNRCSEVPVRRSLYLVILEHLKRWWFGVIFIIFFIEWIFAYIDCWGGTYLLRTTDWRLCRSLRNGLYCVIGRITF